MVVSRSMVRDDYSHILKWFTDSYVNTHAILHTVFYLPSKRGKSVIVLLYITMRSINANSLSTTALFHFKPRNPHEQLGAETSCHLLKTI